MWYLILTLLTNPNEPTMPVNQPVIQTQSTNGDAGEGEAGGDRGTVRPPRP